MSSRILKDLFIPNQVTVPFILWSFLLAVSLNFLSNILSESYGDSKSLKFSVILLILIISILVIHEYMNERKMKGLIDSSIEGQKIEGKYKGLIAFVSECKAQDKKKYLKECTESIKKYKQTKNVDELAGIPSIGQTFKALDYHLKTGDLRHCWLIYSDQSGINVDVMEVFFEIITGDAVKIDFRKIDYPNESKHIKEKIDQIYNDLPEGVKEKDIIADITAGNKPMTAAMVVACYNPNRKLEYIEQSVDKKLIEVVISPKVTYVDL